MTCDRDSPDDVNLVYFAYGSNMLRRQMLDRCSDGVEQGSAALEHWRFMINSRGVATIVEDPGASVHGVLWTVNNRCLEALDRYEGVAAGIYTRETAVVHARNLSVTAIIYVAADTTPGRPRPGYLELIVEGAREHGVDEDVVKAIEAWA